LVVWVLQVALRPHWTTRSEKSQRLLVLVLVLLVLVLVVLGLVVLVVLVVLVFVLLCLLPPHLWYCAPTHGMMLSELNPSTAMGFNSIAIGVGTIDIGMCVGIIDIGVVRFQPKQQV
jgi:uncharacterized membrane protein